MNAHDPNTHDLSQGLTGPQPVRATGYGAPVPPLSRAAEQQRKAEKNKYRSARRYSERVRWLKIGLPVIGAIFIIVFISLAIASQFIQTPLGVAAIDLTDGQVVMDRPKLSGFTASDSEYEIVAEKALQDLDNPKKVLLEKIGATLTLEDGNIVSVDANTGKFDVEGEQLNLGAGVRIHMSAGYTAELEDATIDMKGGILSSNSPIFIKSQLGEIRANSILVRDNGEYILFEDRVRMTVQPDKMRQETK